MNNEEINYIEGTNIPKPRYREVTETNEDYIAYLEDYYQKYFPNINPGFNLDAEALEKASEMTLEAPVKPKEIFRIMGIYVSEKMIQRKKEPGYAARCVEFLRNLRNNLTPTNDYDNVAFEGGKTR